MDWSEIKNATPTELHRRLGELRERIRTLRFRVAAGQEKDVREIRTARKDIARLMTKLRQIQTSTKPTV